MDEKKLGTLTSVVNKVFRNSTNEKRFNVLILDSNDQLEPVTSLSVVILSEVNGLDQDQESPFLGIPPPIMKRSSASPPAPPAILEAEEEDK